MKYRELKQNVHWWSPRIRETACGLTENARVWRDLPLAFTKDRPERITCPRCISVLHARPFAAADIYDQLPPMTEENKIADQAAGNWRLFDSFAWHTQPTDCPPEDCTHIGISHRDSEAIDRVNAEIIEKEFKESPNAWIETHSHWAVGYTNVLVILVYNEMGLITRAWRKWLEIKAQLDEYPSLDDDRLSEVEYNEAWEWWEREATSLCIEKNEEEKLDWDQPFSDAFDLAFSSHSFHDQDYPDDDEVMVALASVGLLREDLYEEETCDCGSRTLWAKNVSDMKWLVRRWCPKCDKKFYMEGTRSVGEERP